ncbi:MAG: D-3-phosphoglycerate dehydrogenase / 2-oxoglutarate reductase [Blastocatellia bacterium]|nr:D-3-phosphoglycerate dehydrogenase / 2-oxoglutarate reductase [Blastocatellia bacterium]
MDQINIFVADDVSESGLEPLKQAGFQLRKQIGLKGQDLLDAVSQCDGLIVRSETKVTAEMMDAATRLRVVGRAGVGVDNIDVPAATSRGIVVMNAPDGNTITTAEHALALLIALARNIPQANQSLRAGKWERKKFLGAELRGKTLGIVGLGRIGRVVAHHANAFGMKILAFDPFVAPDQARDLNIEIASLDEVFANADFLTVHTPLTSETRGIIGARAFSLMKPGVRVINCARGGLIDEAALVSAVKEGRVAGAAIDVFEQEPPPADHPLLQLEQVIVTPHLGASTKEAQEGVAVTVAEQMRDYLSSGALRGAVNVPAVGSQELATLNPYLNLAASLGRLQAQIVEDPIREVRLEFAGEIADLDAAPVTRSFVAGLLSGISARVNAVNAFLIAEERGITITTSYLRGSIATAAPALRTIVATSQSEQTVAGTLFGRVGGDAEGRITEINGFRLEALPQGHMLLTRNRDIPGVIGKIGAIMGENNVNISRFYLGRHERGGEAMAVIETDARVDDDTMNKLKTVAEVVSAKRIQL